MRLTAQRATRAPHTATLPLKKPVRWRLRGLALAACLQATPVLANNFCEWKIGGPGPMVLVRDIGTLYVPRDAAPGSIIGATQPLAFTTDPLGQWVECWFADLAGKTLNFSAVASVPIEPNPLPPVEGDSTDGKILHTNIPGVGAVIRNAYPLARHPLPEIANHFVETSPAVVPYEGIRTPHFSAFIGGVQITRTYSRVSLVKVGPIAPGPHQLNGGELYGGYVSDLGKIFSFGLTGTIIQAQCSVNSNPVSADPVQLGEWQAADFSGPGYTTTAVPFHIKLSNCETDTGLGPVVTAHIRLDGIRGSQPIGPPGNGVFSLTSDSTAQGLGIQLLKADGITPMQLGSEVPMLVISPGDHDLNFNARFYQTDAKVRPGLAKGSLNFTMTYK